MPAKRKPATELIAPTELIAIKGNAEPSMDTGGKSPTQKQKGTQTTPKAQRTQLTLKLDSDRYSWLINHVAKRKGSEGRGVSNQSVFEEMFDAYRAKHDS